MKHIMLLLSIDKNQVLETTDNYSQHVAILQTSRQQVVFAWLVQVVNKFGISKVPCASFISFVETPRKFITAELSIRKLGSSSVLIIMKN